MPLIKDAEQIEDRYARIADSEPVPEEGAVLLSAARFLAGAERIVTRPGATGVAWPNDRDVAELGPYLDRLALVVLVFPTFKDGRGYSQARGLRERFGFRGEIRATGDVLRDQFLFLHRAGFDAFEVRKPEDAPAFCAALRRYNVFYQPAADGAGGAMRHRLNLGSRPRRAVTEPAL
jgi:uncharacterized protein (DUF934 family)